VNHTRTLLAVALASLTASSTRAADPAAVAADTIFHGGTVVTVNARQPQATAVAVKDGNILAVGDKAAILAKHAGKDTRLVDLQGRTLMPGFVEPHVHISLTALTENVALDLSNFKLPYDTIDTILGKLRAAKAKLPEGAWILGFGVDPSRTTPLMAELSADLLDQVSTTNPIFVVNQSGHIAYVNHKALELAGVTDATPDPGNGGVYVKDA
jgi:predicted amidohydrolase YtcJ